MGETNVSSLILENRHSGERLSLRRLPRGGEVWLELKGSLPPHREGPPMHIHVAEDEEGTIQSGTLFAVINGRQFHKGRRRSSADSPRCRASMVELRR